MVENNDEIAEQLGVGSHALVHGLQQPQRPALPVLELLRLLQLWDAQAPAGSTFRQVPAPGLGPLAPTPISLPSHTPVKEQLTGCAHPGPSASGKLSGAVQRSSGLREQLLTATAGVVASAQGASGPLGRAAYWFFCPQPAVGGRLVTDGRTASRSRWTEAGRLCAQAPPPPGCPWLWA